MLIPIPKWLLMVVYPQHEVCGTLLWRCSEDTRFIFFIYIPLSHLQLWCEVHWLEFMYYRHYLNTALGSAGYTIIKYSCQDKHKLSLSSMWVYNMHSAIWKANCMILIKIQSILLCLKSSSTKENNVMARIRFKVVQSRKQHEEW